MREKRLSELFLIGCFMAFLTVVLLVTVFSQKESVSYYENRNLAALPDASREGVLDGGYFQALDAWMEDHCAGRDALLKVRTAFDLGKNVRLLRCPVVNEVVVKDDVLLPYNEFETVDREYLLEHAEMLADNVSSVRDAAEACGGQYLFVVVPCQYVSFREEYPAFLNDRSAYTQAAHEAMKAEFGARGIRMADLGPALLSPETRDRAASRVDNHYTMYGAYLTYRAIMAAINETRETPLPVLEEEEFSIQELPNQYMGSRTRKLFGLTDVQERPDILVPGDPVEFRRYDHGEEVEPEVYAMPETASEPVDYGIYMGGDIAETWIRTDREELPSILIYGDSFTNPVECIIYQGFNEMRSLDMRYYTGMTLGEYIRAYRPDYVICIRDYEQLTNPTFNGCGAD